MKKLLIIPFMAVSVIAVADSPKSAKREANSEAVQNIQQQQGTPQWFHFIGNASSTSDLNDNAKYLPEDDAECPSTTLQYRCDIYALPSAADPNRPNLQTITGERKRSNP